MKVTVLYYSQSGNTERMAREIVTGMLEVEGTEVKTFSIDEIDKQWIDESDCIVLGTPTYYADVAGKVKAFMEVMGKYNLAGKLGGAFATAGYIHGGADIAIQTVLRHMMVHGMMIYSGGSTCGSPVIHLGPVSVGGQENDFAAVFKEYGRRMAVQAKKVFK